MSGALSKSSRGDLAKYDPSKGMQRVAAAEVAEKHYARAKDATKLAHAIRVKLEAQAEFVFWWDTHVEKDKGGRPETTRSRPETGLRAGQNGLPDRKTIHRWRQKLNDPGKFETTYETAFARYVKILELDQTAHVSQNSGENEWYTPPEYVEAARAVLGVIELDPASTDAANAVIKAEQIFTIQDNGLDQQWDGRVWMNPPYAQPLVSQFCEKLIVSVRAATVPAAIVLVNNATETHWFRGVADIASAICFPTGRVRFWSPDKASAAPLQGQAFLYIGESVELFAEQFSQFGFLAVVRR